MSLAEIEILKMSLIIKEVDEINIKDVDQFDNEFVIDSQLVLYVENSEIRYKIIDQPRTKKRYDQDEVDYVTGSGVILVFFL